ncbi:hypothetical protein [Halalkalibacter okhensis]|uniref:Uncharacterized protein n=1 Tax=Halalkalibacter okhensis TaxID=333138 RepID=A0A0B0IGX8_9BACI|nr:hypothetical protein [Halalkalibacter okhensis]KHF38891.1 hypothetical protein LQ50_18335 [Halalkalibacter okhensis]
MANKRKNSQFESGEEVSDLRKGLYGLNPEESLLSVNFATTENTYLNEYVQNDSGKEVEELERTGEEK